MARYGKTHGARARTTLSPIRHEYRAWVAIKNRCYCQSWVGFFRYGGRGIRVCDRWLGEDGFANFLADMGPRPSDAHSIERVDNDGHYTPENCRWATVQEQANNRRSTRKYAYAGETLSISEWSRRVGINKTTLKDRLNRGWSIERALQPEHGNRWKAVERVIRWTEVG